MRQVDKLPNKSHHNIGSSLYDWDTLLDGNIWECTKGVDFNCNCVSFCAAARNAAKKRKVKVETRTVKEYGTERVYIKARKRRPKKAQW